MLTTSMLTAMDRVRVDVAKLVSIEARSIAGNGALAGGPKFRKKTPKKGSKTATPIAVLHCKR
jgi:hypothetical protein